MSALAPPCDLCRIEQVFIIFVVLQQLPFLPPNASVPQSTLWNSICMLDMRVLQHKGEDLFKGLGLLSFLVACIPLFLLVCPQGSQLGFSLRREYIVRKAWASSGILAIKKDGLTYRFIAMLDHHERLIFAQWPTLLNDYLVSKLPWKGSASVKKIILVNYDHGEQFTSKTDLILVVLGMRHELATNLDNLFVFWVLLQPVDSYYHWRKFTDNACHTQNRPKHDFFILSAVYISISHKRIKILSRSLLHGAVLTRFIHRVTNYFSHKPLLHAYCCGVKSLNRRSPLHSSCKRGRDRASEKPSPVHGLGRLSEAEPNMEEVCFVRGPF
jgi:hypothetical protein